MLTLLTKVKLVVFALLAIAVLGYTGLHYANVGQYFGAPGFYVVKAELPSAGGLYTNADVTYRGVSVGRVGVLSLHGSGVQAELDIRNNAPKIPADTQAVVADLSAVGEQYVDLRPQSQAGPFLASDDTIGQASTSIPAPVTDVLSSVDGLANSLPRQSLQTVVNELYNGFNGQGPNLVALLNAASGYTQTATTYIQPTKDLIQQGQSVLATQAAETNAIEAFATSGQQFAAQLASSDSDLRGLINAGPGAAEQITSVLKMNDPDLGLLLANLVTEANVAGPRQHAFDELLSVLPAVVAAGNSVITPHGANLGLALTFFDPLPCTQGYQGTKYRNGLDTSKPPPLNLSAGCTEPVSKGEVRGASHDPKP